MRKLEHAGLELWVNMATGESSCTCGFVCDNGVGCYETRAAQGFVHKTNSCSCGRTDSANFRKDLVLLDTFQMHTQYLIGTYSIRVDY